MRAARAPAGLERGGDRAALRLAVLQVHRGTLGAGIDGCEDPASQSRDRAACELIRATGQDEAFVVAVPVSLDARRPLLGGGSSKNIAKAMTATTSALLRARSTQFSPEAAHRGRTAPAG